ncbi:MAG TPA: hypothetical protein VGH37_09960 [Candidatus Acidoferrum sp.]
MRTNVVYQSVGSGVVTAGAIGKGMVGTPIQGAPYSATITNESIQTLADGSHITQNTTGTTARDSQGRTRQDTALPAIGNLSAADAPHLVFIMDPVAQTFYTLNLTDKTAQKISMPSGGAVGSFRASGGSDTTRMFVTQMGSASVADGAMPPPPQAGFVMHREVMGDEEAQVSTQDLGTETMEGLSVNGVRTTRTVPVGQIGNDKPISIVTEVWTSPDLKIIVYSKRTDPRMGEQTFKLTNIVRAEPDSSLFSVPSDFKIMDGPQSVIYRSNK